MTPAEVTLRELLEGRIGALEDKLDERIDRLDQKIDQLCAREHSAVQAEVIALREQVAELNVWRARMQGAQAALGRFPVVISCVGTAIAVAAAITAWAS